MEKTITFQEMTDYAQSAKDRFEQQWKGENNRQTAILSLVKVIIDSLSKNGETMVQKTGRCKFTVDGTIYTGYVPEIELEDIKRVIDTISAIEASDISNQKKSMIVRFSKTIDDKLM